MYVYVCVYAYVAYVYIYIYVDNISSIDVNLSEFSFMCLSVNPFIYLCACVV